jgi:branched-chain amino acid transport system substrate-binding protein
MRVSYPKTLIVSALVLAVSSGVPAAVAQDTIKIGAVGPKTGPLAVGGAVTHWPNIDYWVHTVNVRGGLRLRNGQRKIELVTYDDRSQPGEAIKAVERLATLDKADFILAPYGTGFNVAVAPIFDKYGYPQLAATTVTDQAPALTRRHKGLFFAQGTVTAYATQTAELLGDLLKQGKIDKRLAMVNVADAFGIEIANASRPIFKSAGFEFVYDTSYPIGTQDLAPVIKAAKAARPDAFVAWSYPQDTFGLTEQANIEGLDVKVFYVCVGAAFPSYVGKFGAKIENVLGGGGVDAGLPAVKSYYQQHKEVTGKDADFWGSPTLFATLQVLEQAIEKDGTLDRKAVTDIILTNAFETIVGQFKYTNQTNEGYWTVGQWQEGIFQAVRSTGRPITGSVRLKSGW